MVRRVKGLRQRALRSFLYAKKVTITSPYFSVATRRPDRHDTAQQAQAVYNEQVVKGKETGVPVDILIQALPTSCTLDAGWN